MTVCFVIFICFVAVVSMLWEKKQYSIQCTGQGHGP